MSAISTIVPTIVLSSVSFPYYVPTFNTVVLYTFCALYGFALGGADLGVPACSVTFGINAGCRLDSFLLIC